ncbi:fimbrial protein [Providencia rettgeri]|uniref:fimbrial protein n=1 Tax=Providencia rettgeri TaxID=587 RepID=UPI0032DBD1CA
MNKLFAFILSCLSIFSAYAVDVVVQLNGGILAQSCNISSADLVKNINFPDLNPKDFAQVGATSTEQEVVIKLLSCTGNVENMSYQFSGEPDVTDLTLLKVLGKSGASLDTVATGLAIEILNSNKQKIPLNTIQKINKTITNSSYDFNFYLRYKSTANDVGPGDASSIVYLDFYYE